MKAYPTVLGEIETLRRVVDGESLARFGDGELQMAARNTGLKFQVADSGLSRRLRELLRWPGQCLVGIPNILSGTPKAKHWNGYKRFSNMLAADVEYTSAFITRPDSAPWIDTAEYWALLESLWVGQDVTLVRGSGRSLMAEDLLGAGVVTEVLAPSQNAWGVYADLLDAIGTPSRALLCLGPTATVMAADLCARGVHAIDLGHVGMFLRKHRRGEPLIVTAADKVAA